MANVLHAHDIQKYSTYNHACYFHGANVRMYDGVLLLLFFDSWYFVSNRESVTFPHHIAFYDWLKFFVDDEHHGKFLKFLRSFVKQWLTLLGARIRSGWFRMTWNCQYKRLCSPTLLVYHTTLLFYHMYKIPVMYYMLSQCTYKLPVKQWASSKIFWFEQWIYMILVKTFESPLFYSIFWLKILKQYKNAKLMQVWSVW